MSTYTPQTPLESAILEAGRFELGADSSGREVLVVGHRRIPKVLLPVETEGVQSLLAMVAAENSWAFTVTHDETFEIEPDEPDGSTDMTAAEEYLVMGLRPLLMDGRSVRIAVRREIVRLFVLPWTIPARTVAFGGVPHFMVTSTRGVVGEWEPTPGGRTGVVVGVLDRWVSLCERNRREGAELTFRCDVPVPWVGDSGLSNAVPTLVGVFDRVPNTGIDAALAFGSNSSGSGTESWLARVPVVMVEGNVVGPVHVPEGVDVDEVADGPWESEAHGLSDFSIAGLT